MGIQEVSVFRGIQQVSARRLPKELINHICICLRDHSKLTMAGHLYMMQNSRNTYIFKLNKIDLHSRRYFTSSNCIFMQLQGIVFIQLQGNYILVNCQGNTDLFKQHKFIHKKYNLSRQLNFDAKLYSFQGTLSVRSRKYILVSQ